MFVAEIDAQEVEEGNVVHESDSIGDTIEAEDASDMVGPEPLKVDFGEFDVTVISDVLHNQDDVMVVTSSLMDANKVR